MASTRAVLLVALSVAMVYTAFGAQEQAECGRQANDAVCLFGACCSEDGMCGRGDEYCGDGCQEGAGRCNEVVKKDYAECGRQAFDAACLFGACCSKDGMCGRGDEFCGDGCQEGAGRCNNSLDAAPTAECGHQAADAVCLFGACCSKEGICGRGDSFCGDGCQENAGRCNSVQNQ